MKRTPSFIILAVTSLLLLPKIIYADIIPPQSNGIFSPSNWIAFGFNFLINYLVLAICYFTIRRKDLLKTGKFTGYIFLVTIGAWLIEYLPWSEKIIRIIDPHTDPFFSSYRSFTFFAGLFIIFLLIAIYNYWLAKIFFKLSKKQLTFISIFTAIFTSPIIGSLISYFSW